MWIFWSPVFEHQTQKNSGLRITRLTENKLVSYRTLCSRHVCRLSPSAAPLHDLNRKWYPSLHRRALVTFAFLKKKTPKKKKTPWLSLWELKERRSTTRASFSKTHRSFRPLLPLRYLKTPDCCFLPLEFGVTQDDQTQQLSTCQ